MRNQDNFEQRHSDLFAHFIQVYTILQNSRWHNSPLEVQINMNHDGKERGNMPSIEDIVFALVYIRQFVGHDDLFVHTCNEYMRFIDDPDKRDYIKECRDSFSAFLKEPPNYIPLQKHVTSRIEFINTFLYGALIIHSPEKVEQNHKLRYEKIYMDRNNRVKAVYELNEAMLQILSIVSGMAPLLSRDFASWQSNGWVPAPNIFWQHTIFSWEPTITTTT